MALQIQEPGHTPKETACTAVGIDLGTTHTLAAIVQDGRNHLIPLSKDGFLLPSVIGLMKKTHNQFVFGAKALTHGQNGEAHIVRSVKRLLNPRDILAASPTIWLGEHAFTPVELTQYLLGHVKQQVEKALRHPLKEVVITVPAYFDERARAATRSAAENIGLSVLRLLSEPTAAALAYGLDENIEGLYGVYDLGGGTFDFSLLAIQEGVFDVRATGGNTHLGGDDVDGAIASHLHPSFSHLSPLDQNNFLLACRNAKEVLSDQKALTFHFREKRYTLTRDTLGTLAAPLMKETITCTRSVLQDAKIHPSDLSGLILVGGATRMPFVRTTLENTFGTTPLLAAHPDHVVALGAGLQAKALTIGGDHLLLDVTPLSLGLETIGDVFEPLIHRNTRIPARATQTFTTAKDHQSQLRIQVLQGEHEKASLNRSLALFELSGIPPLPAGEARIQVVFQLDRDGLLTVSAKEETTNVQQTVHVKPTHNLSLDTAKDLLAL